MIWNEDYFQIEVERAQKRKPATGLPPKRFISYRAQKSPIAKNFTDLDRKRLISDLGPKSPKATNFYWISS